MGQLPAYLCSSCGSPTLPCAGPGCDNMAVRGRGAIRVPRFCAEHRHEIPGFAKADRKMGTLGDYEEFLEYDKSNLSRTAKLVGVGLTGLVGGRSCCPRRCASDRRCCRHAHRWLQRCRRYQLRARPLGWRLAGCRGTGHGRRDRRGHCARRHPGRCAGASVTNAYVREDKSFHIEMLQGGHGRAGGRLQRLSQRERPEVGASGRTSSPSAIPTHLSTGCIGAPRNSRTCEPSPAAGR